MDAVETMRRAAQATRDTEPALADLFDEHATDLARHQSQWPLTPQEQCMGTLCRAAHAAAQAVLAR